MTVEFIVDGHRVSVVRHDMPIAPTSEQIDGLSSISNIIKVAGKVKFKMNKHNKRMLKKQSMRLYFGCKHMLMRKFAKL